ncbi:hypothetical protein BPUN_3365 [Candidatus Paraburkholderia kirkii]|nr:hypothetical protein BPUN_3365 [Candidatus Paraburkholderia kirkii]
MPAGSSSGAANGFLVTSRHVVIDAPSQHFPDRLELELHVDAANLGASEWFSVPLYAAGQSLWRQGIDVAIIEIQRSALPRGASYYAFGPEHLAGPRQMTPTGASLLIVGFPLGFHDSLHHLPVVRQGVLASAFGLRFQGKGCFATDARTHRGTSGVPVVMSARSGEDAPGELPWVLLGVHSSTIDGYERHAARRITGSQQRVVCGHSDDPDRSLAGMRIAFLFTVSSPIRWAERT